MLFDELIQREREEARQEGIEQGIERGLEQGKKESAGMIAINMLNDGMPIDKVAQLTGLSLDELKAIQAKTN